MKTITLDQLLKIEELEELEELEEYKQITIKGDFSKCSDDNFKSCVFKIISLASLKELRFIPKPKSILNGITAAQIRILSPLLGKNILTALDIGMSNAGHQGVSAIAWILAGNHSLETLSMEYLHTAMSDDTTASFALFAEKVNQHKALKRLSLMVPVSVEHKAASPDSKTVQSKRSLSVQSMSEDLSETLANSPKLEVITKCEGRWAYPTHSLDFIWELNIKPHIWVTRRIEQTVEARKKELPRLFSRTANENFLVLEEKPHKPDLQGCCCTIS